MLLHRQKCVSFCRSTSRLGPGRQAAVLSIFPRTPPGAIRGHAGLRWPRGCFFAFLDFAHQDSARQLIPKLNRIVACGNEGHPRFHHGRYGCRI